MSGVSDKLRTHQRESYYKKSLHELHRHRTGLIRGVEDSQREIGVLDAMIGGLLEHRPEGFGAKVEQLRDQKSKLQTAIDGVVVSLEILDEVIAEREQEL